MLRVAEKALKRLLRDDASLLVEVPFEHLPGDVDIRVEHARHGLEEIVRLQRERKRERRQSEFSSRPINRCC